MEPLTKLSGCLFSAFCIITTLASCSYLKKKDLVLKSEEKGFQKENCFFTVQNSLRKDSTLDSKYNFAPFISCKTKDKEHIHFFDKSYLHYEIRDAFKAPNSKTFFAVLDYGVEGGLQRVPLLKSIDDGQTWTEVTQIKKTHFSDLIKGITFTSPLKGTLQLEKDENKFINLYTRDGGKSWTKDKKHKDGFE